MSRMWARRKGRLLVGQKLWMEMKKGVRESSLHNSLYFCRCLEFFMIKIFFKKRNSFSLFGSCTHPELETQPLQSQLLGERALRS